MEGEEVTNERTNENEKINKNEQDLFMSMKKGKKENMDDQELW